MSVQHKVDVNLYVESFKKTHFLLIVLTVLIVLVASSTSSQNELRNKLVLIEKAFTLHDSLAQGGAITWGSGEVNLRTPAIKINDLIVDIAGQSTQGLTMKYMLRPELTNTAYRDSIFFRTNAGRRCSAGVFETSYKETPMIYNNARPVKSAGVGIYLVNFSRDCFLYTYQKNRTGLLVLANKKRVPSQGPIWLIGLPYEDVNYIYDGDLPFVVEKQVFDFNRDALLKEYGGEEPQYISSEGRYVYLPIDEYRARVIEIARSKLKKDYDHDQFNSAFQDLSNMQGLEKNTEFMGMKFESSIFLRFSPLLFLFVCYVLYRRLKLIVQSNKEVECPWLILDAKSNLDYIGSAFVCVIPIASFVCVYCLYFNILDIAFSGVYTAYCYVLFFLTGVFVLLVEKLLFTILLSAYKAR